LRPNPSIDLLLVGPDTTLRAIMETIDANACGIALVVDPEQRLLGTLTDGDLRRALLCGSDLATPGRQLLESKGPPAPITAPLTMPENEQLEQMQRYGLRHIPLLDKENRVVGLARLEDFLNAPQLLGAMVMAGGFGKRLHPLTENTPKPLLPVGDRPLLERLVDQLREAGIRQVKIATHFQADRIKSHFGDGSRVGVNIDYLAEKIPLGTAGALGLIDPPPETLLVINGDILTQLDFRAMFTFHRECGASMTVAVKQYSVDVPYGVVQLDGIHIRDIAEKPTQRFFVLAGIYLLEPLVWQYLVCGEHCDMPDLIKRLVAENERVVSFPIREYWLDIGQLDDYKRATADVAAGRF